MAFSPKFSSRAAGTTTAPSLALVPAPGNAGGPGAQLTVLDWITFAFNNTANVTSISLTLSDENGSTWFTYLQPTTGVATYHFPFTDESGPRVQGNSPVVSATATGTTWALWRLAAGYHYE